MYLLLFIYEFFVKYKFFKIYIYEDDSIVIMVGYKIFHLSVFTSMQLLLILNLLISQLKHR